MHGDLWPPMGHTAIHSSCLWVTREGERERGRGGKRGSSIAAFIPIDLSPSLSPSLAITGLAFFGSGGHGEIGGYVRVPMPPELVLSLQFRLLHNFVVVQSERCGPLRDGILSQIYAGLLLLWWCVERNVEVLGGEPWVMVFWPFQKDDY